MAKLSKSILILFILFSISIMSLFGFALFMVSQEHNMTGCPFMKGATSLCPTDVVEHFAFWKNMFLALPIIMLVAGIVFIALAYQKRLRRLMLFNHSPSLIPGWRSRKNNFEHIVYFIGYLFSQGILHPKIFA